MGCGASVDKNKNKDGEPKSPKPKKGKKGNKGDITPRDPSFVEPVMDVSTPVRHPHVQVPTPQSIKESGGMSPAQNQNAPTEMLFEGASPLPPISFLEVMKMSPKQVDSLQPQQIQRLSQAEVDSLPTDLKDAVRLVQMRNTMVGLEGSGTDIGSHPAGSPQAHGASPGRGGSGAAPPGQAARGNGAGGPAASPQRGELSKPTAAKSARANKEKVAMALEEERSRQREETEDHLKLVLQKEAEILQREEEERKFKSMVDEAKKKDEEDTVNPNLCTSRVVLITGSFGRKSYRYHVPRDTGTVLDLKLALHVDHGYSLKSQRIYYRYREVDDDEIVSKLQDWSDGKTLVFIPTEAPVSVPERLFRPQVADITIREVQMANSANDGRVDGVYPPFRDWTNDLRTILQTKSQSPDLVLDKEQAFGQLQRDFADQARWGAELILQKKVEPTNEIDGVAGTGGDRYFVGGIMLRKVAEWEILDENIGEGDAAFKVAGHEQRALDLLRLNINPDSVVVPLSCIVDHYGVRFLASSVCGINHYSLVYGSSTNALIVRAEEEAEGVAKDIASYCNLAPHFVTERMSGEEKKMYTPFTMEIHVGENALGGDSANPGAPSFYVVNAGRLFPPDHPTVDSIDHLTKLLRPEFVMNYSYGGQVVDGYKQLTSLQPIVCDVCGRDIDEYDYYTYEKRQYDVCRTCYTDVDPDIFKFPYSKLVPVSVPEKMRVPVWKNEDGDVRLSKPVNKTPLNPDAYVLADDPESKNDAGHASVCLANEVIPAFFAELESLAVQPLTGRQLAAEFHKRGINMRYLGRMATEVKYNHLRELAVREMLARTIKVLIRDGMSFMEEFTESGAKAIVLHYLNEIFTPEKTETATTVWKYIEELTFKKFSYVLEEGVRDKIYLLALLHSVAEKLNIKLASYKGYDFSKPTPFEVEDIAEIEPRVKYTPAESKEVQALLGRARELDAAGKRSVWFLAGGPERAKASEMYKEVIKTAEFMYGQADERTADLMYEFAEHMYSRHCEKGRPERSRWNKSQGVAIDDLCLTAIKYYNKALEVRKKIFNFYHPSVADCFSALARCQKDQPVDFTARDPYERNQAVRALRNVVDITETVLGFHHPDTAEAYSNLAMLYQECNDMENASPFVRKAFVIFNSVFGQDSDVTHQCWKVLKSIEVGVDGGLQDVAIEDLASRIEAVDFSEEEDYW